MFLCAGASVCLYVLRIFLDMDIAFQWLFYYYNYEHLITGTYIVRRLNSQQ